MTLIHGLIYDKAAVVFGGYDFAVINSFRLTRFL